MIGIFQKDGYKFHAVLKSEKRPNLDEVLKDALVTWIRSRAPLKEEGRPNDAPAWVIQQWTFRFHHSFAQVVSLGSGGVEVVVAADRPVAMMAITGMLRPFRLDFKPDTEFPPEATVLPASLSSMTDHQIMDLLIQ